MNIGKGIKTVRENAGKSREQLSKKSGISTRTIILIEGNFTFPEPRIIRKLAKALGFHEDAFYLNGLSKEFQHYIKDSL